MRPVHAAAAAAVAGAAAAGVALVRASARSLGAAEERFRRVFEDSPTGMALADLDLCILEANASFGRFLGIPAAELVGRSVASYSHPEDMALTLEHHRGLLAGTAGHYRMEKRYVRADGSLVWGQLTVGARMDVDGCTVIEVIGTELHSLAVIGAAPGHRTGDRWPMRERSLAGLTIAHDGPMVTEDLTAADVDASAELLARGRRPVEFIPVAEESGLIVPLGRWALLEACTHAVALGADYPSMGVNVSSRQLSSTGFIDDVITALERSGLPASGLVLELTESALLEEADSPLPVLEELEARGVSLTLDDFGTGYSSLAYLQRLPLDGLKLDRAFVANMTEDPRAAALVQAVVTMAASLDLTVVAEGIETEAQREALVALGCRYGQGYLFGRPQPAFAPAAQIAAA